MRSYAEIRKAAQEVSNLNQLKKKVLESYRKRPARSVKPEEKLEAKKEALQPELCQVVETPKPEVTKAKEVKEAPKVTPKEAPKKIELKKE